LLTWRHPLHPYQHDGVARLLAEPAVLLADEMGLGKTIQAIAALRLLFAHRTIDSALIVVPAALVLQWRRQLRDWAPELRLATASGTAEERVQAWRRDAEVTLCSYESLRIDRTLPPPFGPARRRWGVLVADEAQRFKNRETELAATMRALRRDRAWALTGTPVENRADDAASLLDFLAPGLYRRSTLLPGLRAALAKVQLRRRRAEVLPFLPPKTAFVVPVDLAPRQRAAYDLAEREGLVWLRDLGARVTVAHVLELILRLKQICNACPESGESAKLDDLLPRLDRALQDGGKALVFSQFVRAPFGVDRIAADLARHRPLLLKGGMTADERNRALTHFETDPERRVMVLSLRAGGVGLNLIAASTVFHLDRWWNPAVELQAEDRAHRIGQTRPVQVFAYETAETIETRIADILAEKRTLFDAVVEDIGLDGLGRLGLADLLRALGTTSGLGTPTSASS
jgi:SNF2 family DNA or RNA helicase